LTYCCNAVNPPNDTPSTGKNSVIALKNRKEMTDLLTEILQESNKVLTAQAVEAELAKLLTTYSEQRMTLAR
jgi:hypothetical protein